MFKPVHLLFALLPLFAGCELLDPRSAPPAPSPVRLQGQLSLKAEQLLFSPCQEQRQFSLADTPGNALLLQARAQFAEHPDPLFADLAGHLGATSTPGSDGQLSLTRLYRLQAEGHGCDDPNFARLLLRASGHEPEWSLIVGNQGLVLERPGQPPLALPYLEEQLPDGRFSLSSAADGLQLELWLTPAQCHDSMSGGLQHLRAELRLNDQVLGGCAAFGGRRSD